MGNLPRFIKVMTEEYDDGSAELAELETGEYGDLGEITPAQKATLYSRGTLKIGNAVLVDVFRDPSAEDFDEWDLWRQTL